MRIIRLSKLPSYPAASTFIQPASAASMTPREECCKSELAGGASWSVLKRASRDVHASANHCRPTWTSRTPVCIMIDPEIQQGTPSATWVSLPPLSQLKFLLPNHSCYQLLFFGPPAIIHLMAAPPMSFVASLAPPSLRRMGAERIYSFYTLVSL